MDSTANTANNTVGVSSMEVGSTVSNSSTPPRPSRLPYRWGQKDTNVGPVDMIYPTWPTHMNINVW